MELERSSELDMSANKEMIMPKLEINRISDGLDFGEGSISLEDRLDSEANKIDRETVLKVEEVIESDKILVPVDVDDDQEPVDDDGCGDGRGVKRIFKGLKELKRSLNRAKVFGGGLVMSVASTVGNGKAKGKQLLEVFKGEISNLDRLKIPYGAHTDDHSRGENSGCGAIDKAPTIITNAVKYRNQITKTIKQLTQGNFDNHQLNSVFSNYQSYADEIKGDESYSGRQVSAQIMDEHKVVKELEGPHLETHIVINTVDGHTVNQPLIREVSDGKAQVFAVDAWRIQKIANQRYDDPEEQAQAYLSMLVYTLATAATLTKGDLPVYIVSRAA